MRAVWRCTVRQPARSIGAFHRVAPALGGVPLVSCYCCCYCCYCCSLPGLAYAPHHEPGREHEQVLQLLHPAIMAAHKHAAHTGQPGAPSVHTYNGACICAMPRAPGHRHSPTNGPPGDGGVVGGGMRAGGGGAPYHAAAARPTRLVQEACGPTRSRNRELAGQYCRRRPAPCNRGRATGECMLGYHPSNRPKAPC